MIYLIYFKEHKDFVNIEEALSDKDFEAMQNKGAKVKLTDEEKKQQRIMLQKKAKEVQMRINERIKSYGINKKSKQIVDEEEDEEDEQVKFEEQEIQEAYESTKPKKKAVHWSDTKKRETTKGAENDSYQDSSEDSITDLINENEAEDDDDDEEEEEDNEIDDEFKPNVIHIKHSQNEPLVSSVVHDVGDFNANTIQTPADIYRVFYKPKSILKAQSSFENLSYNQEIEEKTQSKDISTDNGPKVPFEPLKVRILILFRN